MKHRDPRVNRGLRPAAWSTAASLLLASGCVDPGAADGPLRAPERATFPLVADAMERRCATLDCHGSAGRNLRLYSGSGLRLDPVNLPGSMSTTEAEYDASYRSVVGLEPEILSTVVSEGGAAPERLTLVRKARGLEYHKPGAVIVMGDPTDRCIVSWIASNIDEDQCALGAELGPPGGE